MADEGHRCAQCVEQDVAQLARHGDRTILAESTLFFMFPTLFAERFRIFQPSETIASSKAMTPLFERLVTGVEELFGARGATTALGSAPTQRFDVGALPWSVRDGTLPLALLVDELHRRLAQAEQATFADAAVVRTLLQAQWRGVGRRVHLVPTGDDGSEHHVTLSVPLIGVVRLLRVSKPSAASLTKLRDEMALALDAEFGVAMSARAHAASSTAKTQSLARGEQLRQQLADRRREREDVEIKFRDNEAARVAAHKRVLALLDELAVPFGIRRDDDRVDNAVDIKDNDDDDDNDHVDDFGDDDCFDAFISGTKK